MPDQDITEFFLSRQLKFIESKTYKNGFIWHVAKIRSDYEICNKCGFKSNIRCGKVSVTVKDAPVRNRPLWLRIHKHRYYCRSCRKPFTEPVDCVWPRRRTTYQFRKAIAKDCGRYTNLDLVRKEHGSSSGIYL